MATGVSRRALLTGSAGAFASGTLISMVAGEDAAAADSGTERSSYFGSVVSQTGQNVRVSIPSEMPFTKPQVVTVPMQDFPTGWIFRRGDRVLVTQDSLRQPLAANPLVRKILGTADDYSERSGVRTLTVDGTEVMLQDASVCPDVSPRDAVNTRDGRRFLVHAIENDDGGLPSCFGFRRED